MSGGKSSTHRTKRTIAILCRLAADGRAQISDRDKLEIRQMDWPASDFACRAIWRNHAALRRIGTEVGAASQTAGHSRTLANFFHTLDTALNSQ
jgi:hypothetical protein